MRLRGRQRHRVVTHNRTRLSAQDLLSPAHLLYTNTKASLKHLPVSPTTHTHILPPLQRNPLSSLLFHQNIADEVLSSINHFTALLYCLLPPVHPPPHINHRAHCTSGLGLRYLFFWEWLCCHWMDLHPKWFPFLTHPGIGLFYSLIYLENRSWPFAGLFSFYVDSSLKMEL